MGRAWKERRGLWAPSVGPHVSAASWLKETKIGDAGIWGAFCIFLSHYVEALSTWWQARVTETVYSRPPQTCTHVYAQAHRVTTRTCTHIRMHTRFTCLSPPLKCHLVGGGLECHLKYHLRLFWAFQLYKALVLVCTFCIGLELRNEIGAHGI